MLSTGGRPHATSAVALSSRSRRLARGEGRTFVVIFVLVRQAKLRKRLDLDGIAKAWAERVPGAIAAHWID